MPATTGLTDRSDEIAEALGWDDPSTDITLEHGRYIVWDGAYTWAYDPEDVHAWLEEFDPEAPQFRRTSAPTTTSASLFALSRIPSWR